MLPLPSGLPPNPPLPHPPAQPSSPPPPPPPPRLSIHAFTTAAANASRSPPSRRRPTLHILVVHGSATAPVLRHAHHALCALSAKGVHVFLQTELERLGSPTVTPITLDTVPDAIAACRADFLVLIADRNVSTRTAQVRLNPTSEFIDLPLSDLAEAVLAAWSQQLRAVPDHLQSLVLPTNPNILTTARLDLVLQSYSDIPAIRLSYASLARLVNITHEWQGNPPAKHTISPSTWNHDGAHKLPLEILSSQPIKPAVNNQSSLPPSTDHHQNTPPSNPLVNRALRNGLRHVFYSQTQQPTSAYTKSPKSDLTFCWLKRSQNVSARFLRSQLLAGSLHRNLVATFRSISALPVSPSPSSQFNNAYVSSEAHRQRLLREINDLLSRIEEIGTRLSRRPKTRRRRRLFHEANPWMSYIRAKNRDSGISRASVDDETLLATGGWRCFACHSPNEHHAQECISCRTPSHVLSPGFPQIDSELLTSRFREAIKDVHTRCIPSPWIFAPGVIPSQPSLTPKFLNGILPGGNNLPDLRGGQSTGTDLKSLSRHDAARVPLSIQEAKKSQLQPLSLNNQFQAMSFEDKFVGLGGDMPHNLKTGIDQGVPMRRTPVRGAQAPIDEKIVSSPSLSSSASNGLSGISFISQRTSQDMRPVSPERTQRKTPGKLSPQLMVNHESHDLRQVSNPLVANFSYGVSLVKSPKVTSSQSLPTESLMTSRALLAPEGIALKPNINSAMAELAQGSYEASADIRRFPNMGRRTFSNPAAMPSVNTNGDGPHSDITSLETLAAASDAANGGIGSATQESLRAVSEVVTPGRGQSSSHNQVTLSSYNMF